MNRCSLHRRILLCLVLWVLMPSEAVSFGALADIQYKIKPADGNRWTHLLGNGRIVRGPEAPGKITFTFDDGPDHRTTAVLLDQLETHGIKATFFVNGHRFHDRTAGGEENRAILRQMHRQGHFIGTHTFSHVDITELDEDGWSREVQQVSRQILDITGRPPLLFRPPFGRIDNASAQRLRRDGYTVVMWNLDPLDWRASTPGELLERAKRVITENPEGGVFLLHDTNRVTVEAFPLILEWIGEWNAARAAIGEPGLEIVGIDQFIRH